MPRQPRHSLPAWLTLAVLTAMVVAAAEVTIQIEPDPEGALIGPYPATANCHGLRRHSPNDPRWDQAMKELFDGNLLVILEKARPEPAADGSFWETETIDTFVDRARSDWGVDALCFLPQWSIGGWDGKRAPPDDLFQAAAEAFLQLVRRYAPPGPRHITYWLCNDEWPCDGYWSDHPDEFADRYAWLVREAKKVNRDIKLGGPVNCWPNAGIQRALIETCPELDFIAWNLFTTMSAFTSTEKVFKATRSLGANVMASRQLSQDILGHELPVMVTSYNLNGHAWDPPDDRLARPLGAVWDALALTTMLRAGVSSAVIYNVRALDCGLFGTSDSYAVSAGVLPPVSVGKVFNVRPAAHVQRFVARHFANLRTCRVRTQPTARDLDIFAGADAEGGIGLSFVNTGNEAITINIIAPEPPRRTELAPFQLPLHVLRCDEYGIAVGQADILNAAGRGRIVVPPTGAWLGRWDSP